MFSELAQSTMADPQYCGPLESFTHFGVAGVPGEGPYMQIWMVIANGVICKAAYKSNGCPSSMAAGSMAARLMTGITEENTMLLTGEDLIRILGGLPEGKEECAHRAIAAVHAALANGFLSPDLGGEVR
jgi:nitrogen fixation NifU-like protein